MRKTTVRLMGALAAASLLISASDGADMSIPPDFSGIWARTTFGWELPDSGPGPLKNLQRRANGTSDAQMLVGDYMSPILKPGAAKIVKRYGEMSKAGQAFPDPSNQCVSMGTPYILRINEMQMVQQPDRVLILYMQDHQIRTVRLNDSHPQKVTPTWHGDSIGHYEGGTLVVDTVGIKVGPVSMVDQYGTPHSAALHVVERYRLVNESAAKASSAKNEHEYAKADGPAADGDFVDYTYKGEGIQVEFTVEDPQMFTTPWKGAVTYLRAANDWEERVCAENMFEYYDRAALPIADKPDF
ncbi:MAG TPA: hypothetical protein VGM72_05320 [Micropepsaceae bacterium]